MEESLAGLGDSISQQAELRIPTAHGMSQSVQLMVGHWQPTAYSHSCLRSMGRQRRSSAVALSSMSFTSTSGCSFGMYCLDTPSGCAVLHAELVGGSQGSGCAPLLAVRLLSDLSEHSARAPAAAQEGLDCAGHLRCADVICTRAQAAHKPYPWQAAPNSTMCVGHERVQSCA
jgi:hypothetical protein